MELLHSTNTERGFLMASIITHLTRETIGQIANILAEKWEGKNLSEMVSEMVEELDHFGIDLFENILNRMDMEVIKEIRKADAGVVHDHRAKKILTELGDLVYTRTCMKMTGTDGGYEYPLDKMLGITSHQRTDTAIKLELVKNSADESYASASRHVCKGRLSKMTVCNCVKETIPKERKEQKLKPAVKVLHVDADEAHTRVRQTGEDGKTGSRPVYIPYVSAYEGMEIDSSGRRSCINRIDYARYGLSPEKFCDEVLSELEKVYDLTNAKIYLHCDGGNWLKTLAEYLPNCTVVLDEYHMQKYCKKMASGLAKEEHDFYSGEIYKAVYNADRKRFDELYEELLKGYPKRKQTIKEAYKYLSNHWDAIQIRKKDPEASNGGGSEPHVQHLLACRIKHHGLWSEKNLDHMALYRTLHNEVVFRSPDDWTAGTKEIPKKEQEQNRKCTVANSRGLEDPDTVCTLPGTSAPVSLIQQVLRGIQNGGIPSIL